MGLSVCLFSLAGFFYDGNFALALIICLIYERSVPSTRDLVALLCEVYML